MLSKEVWIGRRRGIVVVLTLTLVNNLESVVTPGGIIYTRQEYRLTNAGIIPFRIQCMGAQKRTNG